MALLNVVIEYSALSRGWAIEACGCPATLMLDAGRGLLCILILPIMTKPKQLTPSAKSGST